jgi:D-inositol-3-phosphate glycosyltransferase
MRIALVADHSPCTLPATTPAGNGRDHASDRVTSLARALAGNGHRVTIYARRDSAGLPGSAILSPGVTVEHLTAGPPQPRDAGDLVTCLPDFGRQLAARWRRNPPDIIHAHFWTSGLAALAAARDLNLPVAQTFSSLGAAEQRYAGPAACPSGVRIRLEAGIARTADVLLASSEEELDDLAGLGAPRAKVKVVPCGVDTAMFSPEGPVAKRNGCPRLVAAQSLTAPRGLAAAMTALAEIPGAELVITGGPGDAELGKHKAYRELRQIARKLRVDDRVVFTGRIEPGDLPALFRSADLLVSTGPYEPVGTAAIQAMACGTPVVASGAGAERDAVVDMTTGLLSSPGKPARLALQVRRLLANPMLLEAYGIAAADRASVRYSWERIARETEAAYVSAQQAAARTAVRHAAPA